MTINRTLKKLCVIVLTWALVIQTVLPVIAAEPATKSKHFQSIPSDAFGIIHTRNIPKVFSGLKESTLFKAGMVFLESDEFKKIAEKDEKILLVKSLVLSLIDSFPKAFTDEFTFSFLDFDKEKEEPDVVLIAEIDEKEFNKMVRNIILPSIEKLSGEKVTVTKSGKLNRIGLEDDEGIYYLIDKGRMVMSGSPGTFDLLDTEDTLADSKIFKETFDRQLITQDTIIFVNLRAILDSVGIDLQNPFLSISGFGSVAGIGMGSQKVENGVMNEITLYSPEKLSGILGLLDHEAASLEIEKLVPESYSVFIRLSVGSFNGLFNDILALLENELGKDSDFLEEFNEGLKGMEEELGISVEKDILGSLGGQVGFALKVPKVVGIPEMAAFLEVRNPKKLKELVQKIIPEEVSFTTTKYKGIDIHTTTVRIVQPTYAFIDNYLVVAISPPVMRDIIDTAKGGKSLLDKQDYKTVFANLPAKGIIVNYQDTATIINMLFPLLQNSIIKAREAARNVRKTRGEEIASKDELFIRIMELLHEGFKEVSGEGMVLSASEKSVNIRQFSGSGFASFPLLSIIAGVALPSLSRAREQARRARSLSNVRQIVLGMKQYALDNDEVFAEKLSELYPDYMSSLDVFRHSSSKNDPITKKEDIDKLTDYAIFPGLTEMAPSDFILIYEKEGLSRGDGRNVGHVDGSAKWLTEEEFQKKMEEQKKKVGEK